MLRVSVLFVPKLLMVREKSQCGGNIMHRTNLLPILIVFGLITLAISSAQAQAYNYTSVDYPNAIRTRTFGISPGGVIVGDYRDSSGNLHGFLLVGGNYITVDVPAALIG